MSQRRARAVRVKAGGLQRTRVLTSSPTLALPEALKLEKDTISYAYLSRKVSSVDGMDDASNFKAVQVGAQVGP